MMKITRSIVAVLLLLNLLTVGVAMAQAAHSANLSWVASSDAAANPSLTYNVYRGPGSCTASTTFTKLNTAAVTGTSYSDTTVTVGNIYCYGVTAVLGSSESTKLTGSTQNAVPVSGPTTIVIVVQ
jgi:fibronectin type 3 domain-containing protein